MWDDEIFSTESKHRIIKSYLEFRVNNKLSSSSNQVWNFQLSLLIKDGGKKFISRKQTLLTLMIWNLVLFQMVSKSISSLIMEILF